MPVLILRVIEEIKIYHTYGLQELLGLPKNSIAFVALNTEKLMQIL
jgi:hypothetical protein